MKKIVNEWDETNAWKEVYSCVFLMIRCERRQSWRRWMESGVALVTGVGRLRGIGRAVCVELAQRGFDIFFTYWSDYDQAMPWSVAADEPAQIQAELTAMGVRCESFELDLSLEDSVNTLLNTVEQVLGPPRILINNATYSTKTGIDTLTASELDRHYAVNLRATTLLTLEFIRRFELGAGGRIINLTSGQSLGPMSDEIAYAVTKGAIETLTTTLAQKIATSGITINAVNPGPNDTGWMSDELRAQLLSAFPMGRVGIPADAAKLIGFLASAEATWITGQVIHSEGGFRRESL